ncbi:adenylate/guanylate cyclase domain-containing protein [Nordella sp. HKS 07]|uniref:CHASE2 domain-containing protein n=1 Tax=Nordella sp. HKS 07 TaxID=2712222 RepID=UPI0013E188B6|nr:adenylate/guanylate cyclase domain-containing protein [Nordella sp. HKS 07]QIG46411.1 adenylate/guanylate cyclase domain-containing protein [Nordella sp. HKS 07]
MTGAGARKTWAGVAVGVAVLIGLMLLRGYDPPLLQYMRNAGFDQLQRIWPREKPRDLPDVVRVVDIDERSLAELGQWPWSRKVLARLVDELSSLGAAVIAFDIIFPEPDRLSPSRVAGDPDLVSGLSPAARQEISATFPDNDEIFAQAIRGRPVVLAFSNAPGNVRKTAPRVAGFAQTGLDASKAPPWIQSVAANIPKLEAEAAGFGGINLDLAREQGIARQTPMLWTDGTGFYPSLALEALRVAQGASTIIVNASDTTENAIDSIRVGDFDIPVAEDGLFAVRYRRDSPDTYVSAARIISGVERDALAPLISGNIVFIGTSAAGLRDVRMSALGEAIPGVLVHAQVVEQVLSNDFLTRPQWAAGAELVAMAALGLALIAILMFWTPMIGAVAGVAAIVFMAAASAYAFRSLGILVDATFPVLAMILTYLATLAFRLLVTDSDRRMLRSAFGHFVSPDVLAEIEKNADALKLGGEVKNISVLFVDIRKSTTLSEKLPPDALVSLINTLLDRWSNSIIAQGGTIDKFIGDAIMAFWNAPMSKSDHQFYAAKAALGIRKATAEINADAGVSGILKERGQWPLQCGVGMSTGPACVGNMGSQTRFDYSAVGETVNIAARTETASKRADFDIVIAGELDPVTRRLAILPAGHVAMAGLSHEMLIWAVVGDEATAQSAAFAELSAAHATLLDDLAHKQENRLSEILEKCVALSREVEPRLAAFYAAIPGRKGDFA